MSDRPPSTEWLYSIEHTYWVVIVYVYSLCFVVICVLACYGNGCMYNLLQECFCSITLPTLDVHISRSSLTH